MLPIIAESFQLKLRVVVELREKGVFHPGMVATMQESARLLREDADDLESLTILSNREKTQVRKLLTTVCSVTS